MRLCEAAYLLIGLIEILRQAHRPRDLDPSVMARAAERSEVATAEMANLARLRVPPLNASKLCAKATAPGVKLAAEPVRSEERRVGNECVSTCRSRLSPSH